MQWCVCALSTYSLEILLVGFGLMGEAIYPCNEIMRFRGVTLFALCSHRYMYGRKRVRLPLSVSGQ